MSSSIWLILAFKIPLVVIVGLLIWWASRANPDESSSSDDDGGIRRLPHPRRPSPPRPRRGPHDGVGGRPPAPPSRVRTTRARARSLGH